MDTTLSVWETATRRERWKHSNKSASAVAYSSDGRFLATGQYNGTIRLYPQRIESGRTPDPTDAELRDAWDELASDDTRAAGRAACLLATHPAKAIPLSRERLRPKSREEADSLRASLDTLAAPGFPARQRAKKELRSMAALAAPALMASLDRPHSVEVASALAELWRSARDTPEGEALRERRAVALLARIGTPEALALLRELASGQPEFELTRDAATTLRRLKAE